MKARWLAVERDWAWPLRDWIELLGVWPWYSSGNAGEPWDCLDGGRLWSRADEAKADMEST